MPALHHPGRTPLPPDTPLQNPAQSVPLHRNRLRLPRNQNRSPGHPHHKSLRRGIPRPDLLQDLPSPNLFYLQSLPDFPEYACCPYSCIKLSSDKNTV